ncbi:putative maltokinase, partial [bacterium]|nr:putative maltokinase [bacterium]
SPQVKRALFPIVDFWARMGVDGFRLDAVPYLYEQEGTSCENLPQTHAFLRELRAHLDAHWPNRMFLAEANQWPDDAAAYFGDGNECHMAYHFPLMPRLFMAIRQEDRFPIAEILEQTPQIPDSSQWALFLRNHDELTLEMVTDEERDYMNRVYARDSRARINLGIRRRLAPLLGNNRRLIELMNALLFSMPGTPVIYGGDEIGMGDNIYLGDRDAVRTPMQWSGDRNAGFSRANPQQLYLPVIIDPAYHYETTNVEAQDASPTSLLAWMRRLIALRKRYKAFSRGSMQLVDTDNRKVLAFVRRHEEGNLLVVANLSRFVQGVHLNLSAFAGAVPAELFGGTRLPALGDAPYFLTLGPHTFFWFVLEEEAPVVMPSATPPEPAMITAPRSWDRVLTQPARHALEAALVQYLPRCRWFGGKGRRLRAVTIASWAWVGRRGHHDYAYTVLRTDFAEGESERYALPLAAVTGDEAFAVETHFPSAVVARVRTGADTPDSLLVDATGTEGFLHAVAAMLRANRSADGSGGTLAASTSREFRAWKPGPDTQSITLLRAEQSNTSINFGGRYIFKLLRRLEEGVHPEVEMHRYFAASAEPVNTTQLVGTLTFTEGRQAMTAGVLETFVSNECDGWTLMLDELKQFLDGVDPSEAPPHVPALGWRELAALTPPDALIERASVALGHARLLGIRTAQMHRALAAPTDNNDFAPEPFIPFYRRGLAQGLRGRSRSAFRALHQHLAQLPKEWRRQAEEVAALEPAIVARMEAIGRRPVGGRRTRTHGDFHLGQVLFTGKDFVIIDFEGEPARPLGERRIKRSPLRDVAGMIRSFHYAAIAAQRTTMPHVEADSEDAAAASDWARVWYRWMSAAFVAAYIEGTHDTGVLPRDEDFSFVLDLYVLEKALYELEYELDNRPDWVSIPLEGIIETMAAAESE